jgi:GNAT superfamily N-acetyltransferase
MAPGMPRLRRARRQDLDAIAGHVQAGFDSYTAFAPAGWRPPRVPADRERMLGLLTHADTWALIAEIPERTIGHVSFVPGRERPGGGAATNWSARPITPGLAHLWQLFVVPDWWGSGIAHRLHEAAITEMRARGYGAARLYTPSGHVRAKRFYERRGWVASGREDNTDLGLALTEYRLGLDPPAR